MEVRRKMLMGGKKVIDTTIKILAENSAWRMGGYLEDWEGNNASIIYAYEPQSVGRQLVYGGLTRQLIIFENGVYKDYWSVRNDDNRDVINANSNGIGVTITASNIDNAYAYLPSNGQILFAGKNTPYYGYTNINDMPT